MIAAVVLWVLQHVGVLSTGFAAALLLVWIVKDALLFPFMRRFYEAEPAGRGMIGESGTVVSELAPEGLVRVRGELWKARAEEEIPAGARVRVRDLEGLTLLVARDSVQAES